MLMHSSISHSPATALSQIPVLLPGYREPAHTDNRLGSTAVSDPSPTRAV